MARNNLVALEPASSQRAWWEMETGLVLKGLAHCQVSVPCKLWHHTALV